MSRDHCHVSSPFRFPLVSFSGLVFMRPEAYGSKIYQILHVICLYLTFFQAVKESVQEQSRKRISDCVVSVWRERGTGRYDGYV